MRILTWNVAHGRATGPNQLFQPSWRFRRNLDAVAGAIRAAEPDVVALQEADGPSVWSGRFDHVAYLAQRADLPWYFWGDHAPPGLGIHYGTALMARRGLQAPSSHAFRANWRDAKGFVIGVAEVAGQDVDVVSVHLDFLRARVRSRQVRAMCEALHGRGRPLVVVGDFNAGRDGAVGELAAALALHSWADGAPTFPWRRPSTRIDWILLSRSLRFVGHQTLADEVSDHLGVLAEIGPA